jgi:type IV secretory pathway TrbD component
VDRGDTRAVENPISAIFDLAEDVNEQLPRIRKVLRYTRVFVSIWLLVDALFIVALPPAPALQVAALISLLLLFVLLLARRVVAMASAKTALAILAGVAAAILVLLFIQGFILGIILVGLFILGMVILEIMADLRGFIDYYALRHRAIKSVRDEDPVAYIPQGSDVVHRLLAYLSNKHPQIMSLMSQPQNVQTPALMRGASGMMYQFDAFVGVRGSSLWRLLGMGSPGFSLFVKAFDHPPTRSDMEALKRAAEDVSAETKSPPSRVIAVWKATGDEGLDAAAYDYVTSEVVDFTHLGNRYRCSLEVITESPDGTYDFVPFVSDGSHVA